VTLDYVGSLSIGGAIPGAATAAAAGAAGINLALPDIQARLAALVAFTPQQGSSFAAQLALAQQIVAGVQAAIALGLSPPSLSAQIAIVAGLVAALEQAVLAVHAQLDIVLDFQALLAAAGIHVYAFAGQADELGPALTGELAAGFPGGTGGNQATNALVLATTVPATWAAMSAVFKVTP
jgi:hypothetical protein